MNKKAIEQINPSSIYGFIVDGFDLGVIYGRPEICDGEIISVKEPRTPQMIGETEQHIPIVSLRKLSGDPDIFFFIRQPSGMFELKNAEAIKVYTQSTSKIKIVPQYIPII